MSLMRKIAACAIALFLVLSAPIVIPVYSAEKGIEVEAEGMAPILNNDKTRARDEAKRYAYRDALEKAIGAYVEGVTEMKDFAVVKDKVFSQAKGVVSDFKIIKEWVDEDNIFHMTAKCIVSEKKLDGVLGPAVIDALGNPRVMVVVDEIVDKDRPFLSTVEGEVLDVFQKAGYLMVDPAQAKALNEKAYELARNTGDVAKLQELAKSFQADVIIYGRAQAIPYTRQVVAGQGIYGVRSQLQLKAIITQTAYILGTEVPEINKKGISAQDGAVKGLKEISRQGASSLIHKVAYSLVSGSAGGVTGRTIKLIVDGIDFAGVRKLKSSLEETRGVVAVYQRAFLNKKLDMDINTEGNAEDLAVRLDEFGLEIVSITANTIEAVPKGAQ